MTEFDVSEEEGREPEQDPSHDTKEDSVHIDGPDGKPRKRRRSTKIITEKKFDCKHPGCGRQYSRAEHLYRHQLNHNPKQIFRCDYPECYREFVRQDLCIRHRERHTTHGSQLQRRDTFMQSPIVTSPSKGEHISSTNHHAATFSPNETPQSPNINHTEPSKTSPIAIRRSFSDTNLGPPGLVGSAASRSSGSVDAQFQPPTPQVRAAEPDRVVKRSDSSSSYAKSPLQKPPFPIFHNADSRHSSFGAIDSQPFHGMSSSPTDLYRNNSQTRTYSGTSVQHPAQSYMYTSHSTSSMTYAPQQLHVSNLPTHSLNGGATSSASFAAAVSHSLSALDPTSNAQYSTFDASGHDLSTTYAPPLFGGDEYNRSPFSMNDDFTAWLFNEGRLGSGSSVHFPPATAGMVPGYHDPNATHSHGFYPQDAVSTYPDIIPQQHPMDIQCILDSSPPVPCMSEDKRQELLYLMSTQFNERPHDAVRKRKDAVFEGDIDDDDHILSLKRMHLYIGSYWYHQHAQLPILHKPTFSADKTPNLLLLAILAIGAATLDKIHGTQLTDTAAEFANFVAWHVRWELVRDADFRPPAKLWVFQALLLIEIYEKMYATRALHERGHIHHDTTLTLMRRGSSLVGRSPFDSPPSVRDDKTGRSSGSNSAIDVPSTDEGWNVWIRTEATKRAAFAAFLMDAIHATMFGHSAKMVAHELRLPLPCDEALWSATSAAEVHRIDKTLQTNGIKPTLFLDGLKKTLNGARVHTNSFGRTILMAGLLSVSWHMNQRDIQITSLGPHNFGGRDKWRSALLRAFDNWKRDFDAALAESRPPQPPVTAKTDPYFAHLPRLRVVDDENIFESRTVLHHLAHMASHADIVECQIYAGASRILGRSITPKDYSSVKDKIDAWATRASARDATFYALKFLSQVLILPENEAERVGTGPANILSMAFDDQNMYFARDDYLLNRPWVCYFAALVVWSYGFALEGPVSPTPAEDTLSTPQERDQDMREYLDRVAGVAAPDDLAQVKGKNRCLGLLMVLRESFAGTRWELMHEAANLLGSCIQKLKGSDPNPLASRSGTNSGREVSQTPSTLGGAPSINGASNGRIGSIGSV